MIETRYCGCDEKWFAEIVKIGFYSKIKVLHKIL